MTTLTFTPEDETRLAHGWPNMIVAIDGHKADKSAAKLALKALDAIDPILFSEWPRGVLHRFVRAAGATLFLRDATKGEETLMKAKRATAVDEPLTPADAIDVLQRVVHSGDEHYPFKVHELVYGVEAIAGTDATLGAIGAELEKFDPSAPRTSTFNTYTKRAVAETIGFMFLRASPKVAAAEKKRIGEAHARSSKIVAAKNLDDYTAYIEALDLSLNGSAAVRRAHAAAPHYVSEHTSFAWLEYAGDDPAYVLEKWALEPKQGMSVRIPHIAGAATLVGLEKRKWRAAEMPSVVRDFGMLRAEPIVTFMLSLIGKSSVKDAPLAWFRAHADYAKPLLQKSKASVAAKAVLSAIG